ncbi:hypothetical protein JS562_54850, partial [Agrobacterium sp. S2]|nr:hypothetical protein [Agrobacterium sp. S2]
MNGPDVDTSTPGVFTPPAHYNNFWADLRSVTNPMVTPSTNDICWAWDQTKPDTSNGINTRMVTPQEAAPAGKMFIVNGSTTLPNPHDVLSTTVSGLTPGATYSFSGQVANVSDSRAVVAAGAGRVLRQGRRRA